MKISVLAGALALAGSAYAQGPRLGAEHQLVLSNDTTTDVAYGSAFGTDAQSFGVSVAPSLDFFVVRNVSIGAGFDVVYQSSRSAGVEATDVGGGVRGRVGVNVPLGRWISWWPRAQIAFDVSHPVVGTVNEAIGGPTIGLYAPLVFQLRTHFFVGFGPYVAHTFDNIQNGGLAVGDDQTTVSLRTVLGGTLGGERDPDEAHVPVARRPFGERREVVLGVGALVQWNGDQTLGSWSVGGSAAAGVEYFVARHLSIGIGAGVGYAHNQFEPTPYDDWNASLRPDVGWDVPISESFSFYPRVSLGLGVSGRTQPTTTAFTMDVGASAQVLYHFAPHVFVGFGPTADVVVLESEQPNAPLDPRTASVGASLSFGGWL